VKPSYAINLSIVEAFYCFCQIFYSK